MKHSKNNIPMIWNDDGGGQMKFKCIYADPPWQYKVYSKKVKAEARKIITLQ